MTEINKNEFLEKELDSYFNELGQKYLMEIVYGDGKIRYQLVNHNFLVYFKIGQELRHDTLPDEIKSINFYETKLKVTKPTEKKYLVDIHTGDKVDLSTIDTGPRLRLTEKGRREIEKRRIERRQKR